MHFCDRKKRRPDKPRGPRSGGKERDGQFGIEHWNGIEHRTNMHFLMIQIEKFGI